MIRKTITINKNSLDGKKFSLDTARLEKLRGGCARTLTCAEPGLHIHHCNLVVTKKVKDDSS